jgi:hypothetical protein
MGKVEVRAGLATRFVDIPDVHYGEDTHWVCGDLGVSEMITLILTLVVTFLMLVFDAGAWLVDKVKS